MATIFRCPHCKAQLEAEDEAIGREVHCPSCNDPVELEPRIASSLGSSDTVPSANRHVIRADDIEPERVIHRTYPTMVLSGPFLLSLLLLVGAAVAAMSLGFGLEAPAVLLAPILLVLGVLFLGLAWLRTRFLHLTVTSERTRLRRGLLSRHTTEVRHRDVATIEVNQNLFQRLFGLGTVALSSAGESDMEIVAKNMRHPEEVARLVRQFQ